jgi:hypothetical protein
MADAAAFRELVARADNALQNRGLLIADRAAAMADWKQFACELGEELFQEIKQAGIANTLINVPPRKLFNRNRQAEWGGKLPRSRRSKTFSCVGCVKSGTISFTVISWI